MNEDNSPNANIIPRDLKDVASIGDVVETSKGYFVEAVVSEISFSCEGCVFYDDSKKSCTTKDESVWCGGNEIIFKRVKDPEKNLAECRSGDIVTIKGKQFLITENVMNCEGCVFYDPSSLSEKCQESLVPCGGMNVIFREVPDVLKKPTQLRAIYVCRLCVQKVLGSWQDWAPQRSGFDGTGGFPSTRRHTCVDKDIGLADLQGWETR